jgi:hypothetical protein
MNGGGKQYVYIVCKKVNIKLSHYKPGLALGAPEG